ncbi:MAG: hypothetical protein ACRCX2_31705 [Paraclostridium sp.]
MRINLTDQIMKEFGIAVTALCEPDNDTEFLVMSARQHNRGSMSMCIHLDCTEYSDDKLSLYARNKNDRHIKRIEYVSEQNSIKRGYKFDSSEVRKYAGVLTQNETWENVIKATPILERVLLKTPCEFIIGGDLVEFHTEGFVLAVEVYTNEALSIEVCEISKFPQEDIPEDESVVTKAVYDKAVNTMIGIANDDSNMKIELAMKIVNLKEEILFTI